MKTCCEKFDDSLIKGKSLKDLSAEGKENPSYANQEFQNLSEQSIHAAKLEHVRWNAYMCSEGFIYHTKKDTAHKMHYDIVPCESLTIEDAIKDI